VRGVFCVGVECGWCVGWMVRLMSVAFGTTVVSEDVDRDTLEVRSGADVHWVDDDSEYGRCDSIFIFGELRWCRGKMSLMLGTS